MKVNKILSSSYILDKISSGGNGPTTEELQELLYGSLEEREALANAISDKGIPTVSSDRLVNMASNIRQIYEGGTALAEHITVGMTAWVNGELITGTRPSPVKIQSGTIQVTAYLNVSNTAVVITFEEEFDEPPTVSVSKGSEWGASNGSSSNNIKYNGISDVTTKGFTLYWYSSGNEGGNGKYRYANFNWTATAKS